MPNSGYKKQTMHTWPQKEASYVAPDHPTHHPTVQLFDVAQQVSEVRATVGHIVDVQKETRGDIKAVRTDIRDDMESLRSVVADLSKLLHEANTKNDARLDAIEIHLARQDAEAAGFKRALRVGGAILSGASVAFGWLLSQAGGAILMSLGLWGK